MISVFAVREDVLAPLPNPMSAALPADALWIDLLNPTAEEEAAVEQRLGISIPTREEASKIEESARLYEEHGVLVMTAVIVTGISERQPATTKVTFVLTATTLATVRSADPLPFRTFAAKCRRHPEAHNTSDLFFLSMLENVVSRLADVLEATDAQLDALADEVFATGAIPVATPGTGSVPRRGARRERRRPPQPELRAVVKRVGRVNSLAGKLRESLLSVGRVLAYFRQGAGERLHDAAKARLQTLDRDAASLTEYDAQLSAEIGFLLEATFGLISLEQNDTIKVFSIAAVLFLPPTLVGTVYGMNFQHMPELGWAFGYPFALLLMAASAAAPYWWFKHRDWL